VPYPADPGLKAVLNCLGVEAEALLGHGGEAWVYALDDERVVRVLHEGSDADQLRRNQELVAELCTGATSYQFPAILEIGEVDGRIYAIERRLAGQSLLEYLQTVEGRRRDLLIEAHLDTAAALGRLPLRPREYFGDLVGPQPVRTTSWRSYLKAKAEESLMEGLRRVPLDAASLASALPEPAHPGFVHLDAFSGNMMTNGSRITAVLDFGSACVVGDVDFAAVAAAVYLAAHEITPSAIPRDSQIANAWLREHNLGELFDPVRRWLAAYWSFAVDDPTVSAWCCSVLAY
jgi:aminoglycoside phosphotransferase (APT) family kinase protein